MLTFEQLRQEAMNCQRCALAQTRQRVVFGEGSRQARLMLIGEGPGASEDREGRPFVGAAGQLLDRILASVGFARDEVFITNVVQCRPPQNRVPFPDELEACRSHLDGKLALLRPDLVVLLGLTATRALLGGTEPMSQLHGQMRMLGGIGFVPTYHPAALLRDPSKKKLVWEDMKKIRHAYDALPARAVAR